MFKITCMKCGNETMFNQGDYELIRNNDHISCEDEGHYMNEGVIFRCKCENMLQECATNVDD